MGIGWKELVLILLVVLVVFGTKKLKNVGTDLGDAVRGFKKGLNGDDGVPPPAKPDPELRDDARKD
jgi:sec-independent protein translocase protein TatA